MRNWMFALGGIAVGVCAAVFGFVFCGGEREVSELPAARRDTASGEITGYGYLRGSSCFVLKNKYGSYVSKVCIYSYNRVKKGDCIIEYDDFDLRVKITDKENEIAKLKQEIKLQETKRQLVKLDPLPSDYRNINWKTHRAKELMERTENEWLVYRRLYRSKSVSDLDMRSKRQAYHDARAAYKISMSDQEKVNKGLRELYNRQAEEQLESLKTELQGLERDLVLLNEQRKYYKITAPCDGIVKTHSDTVGAWNAAATEAACVHVDKYFKVYAYFSEADMPYIKDGCKARIYSHDADVWFEAVSIEITRTRTAVGDGVFHLVKFNVTDDISKQIRKPGKIRVEGAVTVRIPR